MKVNMISSLYSAPRIERAFSVCNEVLMSSSIINKKATIVTPRGQKVDTYDFSNKPGSEFAQDWDM